MNYQGFAPFVIDTGFSTIYHRIIFIMQDDTFGKDREKYTFREQCEEVAGLKLEDGTKKIFLNMTSKNVFQSLISLLQYIKRTDINNPEIIYMDERIIGLDRIVTKVKQSEECI